MYASRKVEMVLYMVLLVPLLVISSSSPTDTGRNVYCWRQRARYYGEYTPNLYCKNMDVRKDNVLGIKNQTSANKDIRKVNFVSVSGQIGEGALDLFPKVESLFVVRSSLTEISLKSTVKVLLIIKSGFPKVTSEALKGVTQIQTLGFLGNSGLEFESGAFKGHKNLTYLMIMKQNMPRLQRSFLEGPDGLLGLYLVLDNITKVDEDAFDSQPYLMRIHLDDNPLEYFKAKVSNLRNLQELSLINTNLKEISFDIRGSFLRKLSLSPSVLLNNFNSTMLKIKFPKLDSISIPHDELENPEIIPIEDMLKRNGIRLVGFKSLQFMDEDEWLQRELLYSSVRC